MVDTNRIAEMIEPSLAAMGYGLVRVAMTSGRRATLQIMIERLDDLPITLDDCKQISHSVSSLLDVADPIAGGYLLEISSPGIDRPLVRKEDYNRFSGCEARIELAEPLVPATAPYANPPLATSTTASATYATTCFVEPDICGRVEQPNL